jgi:tetratricopeptide (TPR) repeat protein
MWAVFTFIIAVKVNVNIVNIFMLVSHKILVVSKVIRIAATISIFGTISVVQTSIAIDKTTGSITQLLGAASPLENKQGWQGIISQKTTSKADDYFNSGVQKFKKQDYQGALHDYNRAIKLNPNFVEAYNYRGNLKQNKLQDYKGALADFNRAIQLEPNYALLYKNRGVLKVAHLQDNRGALVDLNRAIQLDPNFAEAYGQRGGIKHEILNDRVGGIADTQEAARLFKQQGDNNNYQVAIGLLKKWQQIGKNSSR